MLTMNDLKVGTIFIFEDQPWEVLEARHYKVQQRRPVLQTKIRNLVTGQVRHENFQTFHTFEEADIEKKKVKFLFKHRQMYTFCDPNDPSKRFSLPEESLGDLIYFLKNNIEVDAVSFQGKIINIDTAPGVKGNTEAGGTKDATIETGYTIKVPLFVEIGDIVRVNTKTGQYDSRVQE
jgi:elongation factor P